LLQVTNYNGFAAAVARKIRDVCEQRVCHRRVVIAVNSTSSTSSNVINHNKRWGIAMRNFKLNPLVLAMAVCTLPIGAYAQNAQDTGDGTVEEVIVTGSFRDSLANAMNIKRNESGFVDAIVASDIAEFPDNNLAESLQRIPGVAITRSGGEGRQIAVRGLGSAFTTVRLNGMETVSTTGGTDAVGGNNRSRGFDFNTFSSDLFSSLTVRKTGVAEIAEGSLGATVDLKAAQPFDYDGFVFTAAGQMGYNDLSEESNPGASFLVSNTFADGKFGALFSLSYSERDVKDEGSSTVRWSEASANRFGFLKGAPITASHEVNSSFKPRIPRYDSYTHEMERLGSSLSLQFRPTDTTEISLDGLWAKFDTTRQELFMQASLNPGTNVTSGNVLDYAIEGDTLVYADLAGIRLLSENRFDKASTDFSQGTITLKQDLGDSFRINAMYGETKSDYSNPIQNTLLMQASNQRFTYDYRDYEPTLTFGDAAYDKASWVATAVRQRPQSTLNESEAAKINFEYDLVEGLTLKFGVEQKEFNFNTEQYSYQNGEGANGVNIQSNPDFISEYDSGLGDGRPWLIPNRAAIMDAYKLFDLPMVLNTSSTSTTGTYDVSEETLGYFVQVDFSTEIAGMPFRGDLGVRRFDTEQSTSGFLLTTPPQWISIDHDYSDTLPALNLSLEPAEDFLLRASYSEGISRAGLSQLTPATSVTVNGTNRQVSGSNPFLEPTKAKSYDLGFEWYFTEEGMIAVTLFKKEIASHIQTINSSRVYSELASELGLPLQAAVTACTNNGAALGGYGPNCNENIAWQYSAPTNGPGGDLDGYEISYQQPFTFLPGIFANFGFIGSYTSIESDMDYLSATGAPQTKPLIDLSDETTSATLYYEDDAFSGRVSVATRSGYLTTPIGRDGNIEEGTNETLNVDASFGYQFNDSLKFTFEALNLTDEVDDQWVGSEGEKRLSYYHSTGRQYNLGVQYKF
jgi:iron complex outermembrane receptor protein